ncbi:MAG TPA: hypothetical protein DCW45_09240 [Opitutae bacterium]|nr:hypothetical protein [Opitutae bacterium]
MVIGESSKSYPLHYLDKHSFGCCFYPSFFRLKNPEEEPFNVGIFIVSSFLLFGSLIKHILILPKREKNSIPLFLARMSLAEAFIFVGIFLTPYYQVLFLAMSIVCNATYIPVFIKVRSRTGEEEDMVSIAKR